MIITRNGHPNSILLKFEEGDLEDFILANHFDLENEFENAKEESKTGKTKNVRDLLKTIK